MRRALALASLLGFNAHAEIVVLKADAWIDVDTGRRVTPGIVVVEGELIKAVNPAMLPRGARVVELAGLTLLPGFIDMHVHLDSDLGEGWESRGVEWTDIDHALLGVRYARATLDSGFTTVRNVGSSGFMDVSLMRAIERGDFPGPRVVPAGHAIGATGGHCDATGYAPACARRVRSAAWTTGPTRSRRRSATRSSTAPG